MTGVELAAPQKQFMQALLSGRDIKLTAQIPEDADFPRLLSELSLCCGVLQHFDHLGNAIKPIVGRILVLIQERGLYRPDYSTFEDFQRDKVERQFGMSRATLFKCKKVARAFPNLALSECQEIRSENLALAARFTDHTERGHAKVLAAAKSHSVEGFRAWGVEQGFLESGDAEAGRILIHTDQKIAKLWNLWIANEDVQAWAESGNPGVILERMMQEVSTEVQRASQ